MLINYHSIGASPVARRPFRGPGSGRGSPVKTWIMKKKLKRFATSLLPVAANRVGECNRCGECCKLPYPCPFLRYDAEGLSMCAIYAFRPPSCRKYPRTEDENLTPQVCGFSFVPRASGVEVPAPDPLDPLVPAEQSA